MAIEVQGEDTHSLQKKIQSLEKEVFKLKKTAVSRSLSQKDEYAQVLKSAPYIFLIVDSQHVIREANDLAHDFFVGYLTGAPDSLVGTSLENLLNSKLEIENLLCKAFQGQRAKGEIKLNLQDKKTTWLNCSFAPIFSENTSDIERISIIACDITERKKDEDTLKQSEAWLKQIYGDAPVLIYAIDDQAVLRHANKKWLESTGYSRNEVVGKKIKNFLAEASKSLVFGQAIPEFLKKGKIQDKRAQIIKKNGELMDIRYAAIRSVDSSGNMLALTVVEDITEIQRTREALIESDEQYKKLVESLPDVVLVTDIFGNIRYASPSIDSLKIRGLHDDIVGKNLLTIIKPVFHDEYLQHAQMLIDGKENVVGIYEFEAMCEEVLKIEVRSSQLNDAHGKPKGFISTLRNITVEQKAQEKLKLNEQILEQISESSADIIWVMDQQYKLTFVSKASESILGYTPEEAKKLSLEVLQSAGDLQKKKDAHKGKFPKKRKPGEIFEPVHLEVQHIHKHGNKVWTDMLSSPLYNKNDEFCGLIGIIRDNSERKATELAVRESQELYRSLIELSPEGIIIINHGKIEFANREFIKMLKVVREKQIVERNFLDLVKLKDHAKVRKWLKRVEQFKADNEVILVELDRFDRTPLHAEVMATPVTIRGEKSAQLFVRDVTQRILTGKELSKERELNENLIKSIPDFIYFKDAAGKFIKINRAFSKALGLKNPEEAIGKSDKHFFGIKHFQRTQKEEQQIIKTKKPLIGCIREESWTNENIKWVSVTKMPLYGPDREVVGTYGVSRNITKQKQSEEELRKREERFRRLFGQVQVGMAIINPKFEILDVNDTLCGILKFRKKEIIDINILSLLDKEEKDLLRAYLKNSNTKGAEDYQSECTLTTKNGDRIHVILKIVRLDSQGEFKDQLLFQVIDIHDRKEAEDQLLVRNNELNNFVYKVSHDLRAPLLSVKGLINLIRLEKGEEVQESYIDMIETRVEKLDGFIRDILSHSKNLNTQVEIAEVDLKQIIEHCFNQMQYHTNAKKISKSVSVKGAKLYSDSQRLQEIMRNLISNAIIYSSAERVNSFVSVKVRCGQNVCTIIVEDNGIGIKKVFQDKIFQMFYRANEQVEGSGIGLYIVQQSIHKLGGEVHVESKLNSGTKFTLTIPNNLPKL